MSNDNDEILPLEIRRAQETLASLSPNAGAAPVLDQAHHLLDYAAAQWRRGNRLEVLTIELRKERDAALGRATHAETREELQRRDLADARLGGAAMKQLYEACCAERDALRHELAEVRAGVEAARAGAFAEAIAVCERIIENREHVGLPTVMLTNAIADIREAAASEPEADRNGDADRELGRNVRELVGLAQLAGTEGEIRIQASPSENGSITDVLIDVMGLCDGGDPGCVANQVNGLDAAIYRALVQARFNSDDDAVAEAAAKLAEGGES
jgi:hypothetical protein